MLPKQMYLFLTQGMEASRVEDISQRQDCKLEGHSRKITCGTLSKNKTKRKKPKNKNPCTCFLSPIPPQSWNIRGRVEEMGRSDILI